MKLLRILLVVGAVAGAAFSARPSYAGAEGEDTTPPECAITGASPTTFFPRLDGYRDAARLTYDASDDSAPFDLNVQVMVLIPDAGGELAYTGPVELIPNPGQDLQLTWDGRDDQAVLVPEGEYDVMIHVFDGNANSNDCTQRFTVDHAKLTKKTFKRTVSVHDSQLAKLVGDCSLLRKPSLRGWEGSAGYYSNKRCSEPGEASIVGTANGILVPDAFDDRYHSLQVKLYGGAATARRGSDAQLMYLKKDLNADPVLWRTMGPRLGTHAGATTNKARGFIRLDDNDSPYVAWQLLAHSGNHYDVRDFTVVLTYTALWPAPNTARTATAPRVHLDARSIATR